MALLYLSQEAGSSIPLAEPCCVTDATAIRACLAERGVSLEQWPTPVVLAHDATQEAILQAYAAYITPFMQRHGYQTADVLHVRHDTLSAEALAGLRAKFKQEHTHSEDEVRFFLAGQGYFWFRFATGEVACVQCQAGDFISVPAGLTHWFELEASPNVSVIRLFSTTEGWVPNYTGSGVDEHHHRHHERLVSVFNQAVGHLSPHALQSTVEEAEVLLFDIEGTITDIAFVHRVLFPYASEQLIAFVQEQLSTSSVQHVLESVRATLVAEESPLLSKADPLVHTEAVTHPTLLALLLEQLHEWILADRKHPALKALQGQLWRKGYETGAFVGHLYPDVLPWWQQWKERGKRLAIYSSGSVEAQQLLLGYSTVGDVTPLIEGYFDTAVGAKHEVGSYRSIAEALRVPPKACVFFSDRRAELEAAQQAGMTAIQLCRESRFTLPANEQFPAYCHAFY
ncbi:MAG: acireductone synthase [Vampirovibrionales bacterium]